MGGCHGLGHQVLQIDWTGWKMQIQSCCPLFASLEDIDDGIYPSYSRFARGIKVPANREEKKYTSWQEGVRKDVERAFGVLKNTWQFLDRPILLHDLTDISNRVVSCLLLHNIFITDRVMQEASDTCYNYRERYDPSVGAATSRSSNRAKCSCRRKKNSHWNQQCPSFIVFGSGVEISSSMTLSLYPAVLRMGCLVSTKDSTFDECDPKRQMPSVQHHQLD
jgi:hypothetical protein